MRFQPDGSQPKVIATGLRNSVGFDWAPWSGEIYATDNGRDLLGDDFPICELNRVTSGGFYGWPYFNGDNIPDPDMGEDPRGDEREAIPPVHGFRAHNAPLGIAFLDGKTLPSQYQRSALVALHGPGIAVSQMGIRWCRCTGVTLELKSETFFQDSTIKATLLAALSILCRALMG